MHAQVMHLRYFARFFLLSVISLSSFLYADSFSSSHFYSSLHLSSMNSLFFLSPLRSLVLHHSYRLSYTYFSPTLSLFYFFLMHSDTVAFLSPPENALVVVTSIQSCRVSAEWYTRCIPVRVYMHIARRGMKRTDVAPRLYLGFVGDAFVTLTGSFLFPSFFLFFSSTPLSRVRRIGQDDLLTGNRKANSISERVSIYILSDSYSLKNRLHICLYIFLFSCWNI